MHPRPARLQSTVCMVVGGGGRRCATAGTLNLADDEEGGVCNGGRGVEVCDSFGLPPRPPFPRRRRAHLVDRPGRDALDLRRRGRAAAAAQPGVWGVGPQRRGRDRDVPGARALLRHDAHLGLHPAHGLVCCAETVLPFFASFCATGFFLQRGQKCFRSSVTPIAHCISFRTHHMCETYLERRSRKGVRNVRVVCGHNWTAGASCSSAPGRC